MMSTLASTTEYWYIVCGLLYFFISPAKLTYIYTHIHVHNVHVCVYPLTHYHAAMGREVTKEWKIGTAAQFKL